MRNILLLLFKARLKTLMIFAITSGLLWLILEGYRIRSYLSVIILLFGVLVILNDLLEHFVLIRTGLNTRWFRLFMAPGTVLHELSHLFVAMFSGCTITSVKLFDPNPRTGLLGYVSYTQPRDRWSALREVSIGFSPFFVCGTAFTLIALFLYPSSVLKVFDIGNVTGMVTPLIERSTDFMISFSERMLKINLFNPLVWIALYLQYCFALGSAPSTKDFEGSFLAPLRHPVSTLFSVIMVWATVKVVEDPLLLGLIGEYYASFVMIVLSWSILLLVFSIAVHALSLIVTVTAGFLTEIKGTSRYIPPSASVAGYLFSTRILGLKHSALLVALIIMVGLTILLRYPDSFYKKT